MFLAPSSFLKMRSLTPKLHFSIIIALAFGLAFIALLYTESIRLISSTSVFNLKSCSKRHSFFKKINQYFFYVNDDFGRILTKYMKTDDQIVEDKVERSEYIDDRFEFDIEECNIADGKWVFNESMKPLYTDESCRYVDRQVSCGKNGRPDSKYLHWEWQPEDCTLPRFNPQVALNKLRGKRLLFVGDSLQRGQWQSFVCLVESIIPADKKSIKRGAIHTVFKAKEYDATIEFYWAPFLVESNTDRPVLGDPKKRIIKVDSIAERAKFWEGVDFLVFNSYVWWMSGLKIRTLWGSFANGDEGAEEMPTAIAYKLGLKTWANWVDSTINPNKTKVFFTTMSPTHMRNEDWGNKGGIKCFNETKPIKKKNPWGTGSNKELMSVVASVIKKMKVHVTLLNITQISEYRIDAHTSVYTETGGKLLTPKEKDDPLHYADCIHWCLPGVPDTWNQLFLASM